MLAEQQVEGAEGGDAHERVDDARADLVDAEDREPGRVEHVHERRPHVAQLRVEHPPVGPAHQVAPVPADDVPLLQQGFSAGGGSSFVVPQRGVVEVDEA